MIACVLSTIIPSRANTSNSEVAGDRTLDGDNGAEAGLGNKPDEEPCAELSSRAVVRIEGATLSSASIRRALPFPGTRSTSGESCRLTGRVGRDACRASLKQPLMRLR